MPTVLVFHRQQTICLWVIGVVTVNVSSETLSRAYYGCFSELRVVPSSGGWMSFDQGAMDITVQCVVPRKVRQGALLYDR